MKTEIESRTEYVNRAWQRALERARERRAVDPIWCASLAEEEAGEEWDQSTDEERRQLVAE